VSEGSSLDIVRVLGFISEDDGSTWRAEVQCCFPPHSLLSCDNTAGDCGTFTGIKLKVRVQAAEQMYEVYSKVIYPMLGRCKITDSNQQSR
jgi:hypothetical protein